MTPCERSLLAAFAFALSIIASPAHALGSLNVDASGIGPATVRVQWNYDESEPVGRPDWVGYDVLRRVNGTCGAFERLNQDPIARPSGSHALSWDDTPPVAGESYQYAVHMVNAAHERIQLGLPACDPCVSTTWASAPDQSAPVTQGTLVMIGPFAFVQPCGNTCFPSVYVDNPDAGLVAYAAAGTPVRLWGNPYCGTVEGCGLTVDRYEPVVCGITPVREASWARVKTLYR